MTAMDRRRSRSIVPFVKRLRMGGDATRKLKGSHIRIPEMKVIADDINQRQRVQTAIGTEDTSEHLAIGQHDSAAVRNIRLYPAPDHRQQLGVSFVVGS